MNTPLLIVAFAACLFAFRGFRRGRNTEFISGLILAGLFVLGSYYLGGE